MKPHGQIAARNTKWIWCSNMDSDLDFTLFSLTPPGNGLGGRNIMWDGIPVFLYNDGRAKVNPNTVALNIDFFLLSRPRRSTMRTTRRPTSFTVWSPCCPRSIRTRYGRELSTTAFYNKEARRMNIHHCLFPIFDWHFRPGDSAVRALLKGPGVEQGTISLR